MRTTKEIRAITGTRFSKAHSKAIVEDLADAMMHLKRLIGFANYRGNFCESNVIEGGSAWHLTPAENKEWDAMCIIAEHFLREPEASE